MEQSYILDEDGGRIEVLRWSDDVFGDAEMQIHDDGEGGKTVIVSRPGSSFFLGNLSQGGLVQIRDFINDQLGVQQ